MLPQQKLSSRAIAARVGADGDDVAHRLVDGRGRHRVGIEVAVARVDAAADRQAGPRAEHRQHDRGIAGAVVVHADQRLDDAAALHLVVVLADDPFLAADVAATTGS